MELHALVREIRKDARLTQTQLAERLGCSQSLITVWEGGGRARFPSLLEMYALLDACSADDVRRLAAFRTLAEVSAEAGALLAAFRSLQPQTEGSELAAWVTFCSLQPAPAHVNG